MKISDVAAKSNLSKNTIRYYIDIGLLVPTRKGNLFFFNEDTLIDIEWIQKLKDMDFSLKEIHEILSLKRVSNLVEHEDLNDYTTKLKQQKIELKTKILDITNKIEKIDSEIEITSSKKVKSHKSSGLPVKSLEFLYCPLCQNRLEISNVQMNHKYVFSGKLNCKCGYSAEIIDGIILTDSKNKSIYDKPDLTRELYKDIPPDLVTLFQKSYNWMLKNLDGSMDDKIVMETNINAYFFLYTHFKKLKNNCLYIIVDKFPETLAMYKERIEMLDLDLDILFIANEDYKLPLKNSCVDIFIDYFGTNEHCIYKDYFLIDELNKYLNLTSRIVGTYFYFEKNSESFKVLKSEYPDTYEHNFRFAELIHNYKENGFIINNDKQIGFITNSGDNLAFSFHLDNEKMHIYSYEAVKNK